ncbi:histidine phosphatase family protein [uncultured Tessaracoccus sp.]|uniref:histidine phosphatase family protein n=1 Tax=uncultured Tessaracoccus sp. TaxID=905023 RepID=UPI0025D076F1|nr:histidine phosphatase family protein [uncultured Tessaracoccus sp.]
MRLILIRHGQTDSNVQHLLDTQHPGAPLNATGREQAEELVARIAHEPVEALYTSDLTRAVQTAEPLAQALGLEPTVLPGLREISAGDDEMSPDWERYVSVLESWSPTNLDVSVPGGETAREFAARYVGAVRTIEAAGHRVAAVVSHGAAIRVFGLSVDTSLRIDEALPLKNTEWIVLEGSTDEGWRIVQWADLDVPTDAVAEELNEG